MIGAAIFKPKVRLRPEKQTTLVLLSGPLGKHHQSPLDFVPETKA
jgi:hypothetical protein